MVPHVGGLMSYLRRLSAPEGDSDAALLGRFHGGDGAAFAALLRRHAPLVWGVCRRVLGCPQDAEDAFQAVFLVLLHRAGSLRRSEPLAPWLHRVAWRTAVKARARDRRRAAREASASPRPEPPDDLARRELRGLLDAEIDRLPERYRLPVTLCYLEGLTNEEAARRLGCPRGTILSRLARARERLRRQLTRRGIDGAGAAAAGSADHLAGPGAPAHLLDAVLRAGVPTEPITALVKGVLLTMFVERFKVALAVVLAVALVGGGASWVGSRPGDASVTALQPTGAVAPDTPRAPPAARADEKKADPKPPEEKTPEASPPQTLDRSVADLRKLLNKQIEYPGVEAREAKLGEVLEQWQKMYHLKFDVNEAAFKGELKDFDILNFKIADPNPIPPMRSSMEVVLRTILRRIPTSSPAMSLLHKDYRLELTTEHAVRAALQMPKSRQLLPLINEDFRAVTLAQALPALAEASGLSVILDPRADKQASEALTAQLRNVPVDTALLTLTDMVDLEVVRLDNVFYVTTPDNAIRLRKKRAGTCGR